MGGLALAAGLLSGPAMRRLSTLAVVAGLLVAMPARAEVHLLPDAAAAVTDAGRLAGEVTTSGSKDGAVAMGLGVASLVAGAASLLVGVGAATAGEWQFFVPMVVIVPLITSTLGIVLVTAGAIAQAVASDEVVPLEGPALAARRAELLRARDVPLSVEGCREVAVVESSAPLPAQLSNPPLVPTGHVRGPLVPAPSAP